jgi:hypothetical protein
MVVVYARFTPCMARWRASAHSTGCFVADGRDATGKSIQPGEVEKRAGCDTQARLVEGHELAHEQRLERAVAARAADAFDASARDGLPVSDDRDTPTRTLS